MSPNQQLKREAKFQLRGHWPQALAVTAVYLTATLFFAVLQEGLLVLTGVIPLKAALGEIQIAQDVYKRQGLLPAGFSEFMDVRPRGRGL